MISILIPVYNEEAILGESAHKLHAYLCSRSLDHEIIVTSNGSTDSTEQIGRQLEKDYSWFRFFSLPQKGVGSAFVNAVREARGEFLISLDVDLSCDLTFIDYANDLLRYADIVVGSKTMGRQRRSFFRIFASQAYISFVQIFFNLTITDFSIGSKAYRRESILPALPFLDAWTGYVFELCAFIELKGPPSARKRIVQIGVDCNDHRKSHFSLLHEGIYRYFHLFRQWRIIQSDRSWFNTI